MQEPTDKTGGAVDRLIYKVSRLAQNKLAVSVIATLFFGSLFGVALTTPQTQAANNKADQYFGVKKVSDSTDLGNRDLIKTVSDIINVALGLLGIVAVVIILFGGFKWMTASGNEEKVEDARNIIFQGIIGLAIILSAWAISRFVITNLAEATRSGAGSGGTFNPNNP